MWQANRAKLSSARVWESIRLRLRKDNATVLSSAELDAILAEIMTLSMPPVRMRTDEVGAMLMALAEALPPRSELLVSEFTSVVRHCCKDKLTLTSDQLQVLIPFFLAALSHCPSWYAEQILTTLSIILADNAASAAPLHDTIYAAATPHLDPSSADVGARYAATTCMAHVVAVTEAPPPYFASLWKHTMDNFQQQTRQLHSDAPRVVWTTNRTHYKVTIFLTLKHRSLNLPAELPRQFTVPAPPGRVVEPHMPKVLDSLRLLLGLAARLRLEVVRAFEVVLQSFPQLIAPTLALYLPTTTSPCLVLYNHQPSVLTVAVVDPYDQVRLKVLHWLDLLLPVVNAKATLSQNFKNASSMAFTTTGGALVRMIHQVHLVVLHTLQYEHDSAVLVQAIKTLTTLVSLCPYPNMLQASSTPATLSLDAILQALAHYLHNALFAPVVKGHWGHSPWLLRLLPPDSIDQVLRCMLHLVDDNDKVASSVVRTLGLLTRWIVSAQYLEASDHSTPFTGDLETLANTTLLTDAMTVLAKKVVRISAAMALRISCARASYGVFFHGIVQTILDALDAAVDLTDISEYKYKAQLELQYAAIFGEEAVDCAEDNVAEGHEVNPVSCAQVVDACDVLRRVIQQHCPHTASCLAQIAEVKLIFEMDMLDAIGFEF
ncbi:hypothetical protein DYB32_005174 [Aphanomyces invadans]|uniref:DUF4042 domain-containing protein n=1 Tax=Aphanomyces invadans TaxID=157072 RepID=A0A418AV63_9STRA|nr:hypothetical protein DYB32_005174 [Aphanomyces invadans]